MSLFKKNKTSPQFEFTEFTKSDKTKGLLTSFDQMEYFVLEKRSDEDMLKLCDTILSGKAVLANFDKVNGNDCNYMLSFISGVIYAKEGQVIQLGTKLFLFGGKEQYEDGSLLQYVEDNK